MNHLYTVTPGVGLDDLTTDVESLSESENSQVMTSKREPTRERKVEVGDLKDLALTTTQGSPPSMEKR